MRSVEDIIQEQHEQRMLRAPLEIEYAKARPLVLTERARRDVLELRDEGLTHQQIASRLGMSSSVVARAIKGRR